MRISKFNICKYYLNTKYNRRRWSVYGKTCAFRNQAKHCLKNELFAWSVYLRAIELNWEQKIGLDQKSCKHDVYVVMLPKQLCWFRDMYLFDYGFIKESVCVMFNRKEPFPDQLIFIWDEHYRQRCEWYILHRNFHWYICTSLNLCFGAIVLQNRVITHMLFNLDFQHSFT